MTLTQTMIVGFTDLPVTFPITPDRVNVRVGDTLVLTVELGQDAIAAGAKLDTAPVFWTAGSPPGVTIDRVSDTEIKITETNAQPPSTGGVVYGFYLVVDYKGSLISTFDPTIVNGGTGN